MKMFYKKYGCYLLSSLSLILILTTLFSGDNIGLSDNGDFMRVMRAQNLQVIENDKAFTYISEYSIVLDGETRLQKLSDLLFSTEELRNYPSIHQAFVRIGVILSFAVNMLRGYGPIFSLSYLGVIYCVLYSLALLSLFRTFHFENTVIDISYKLFLIMVLCDVGYVSYFNSLYSEPVQIIFLVLMISTFIRLIQAKKRAYFQFCIYAVIFGWAKFANIPTALIAIVIIGIVEFTRNGRAKITLLYAIASVAVLLAALSIVPKWMSFETNYNAVFYGAVKDVDDAAAVNYLGDLDIPEKYARLAGTNRWVSRVADIINSDEFREDFNVGKIKLSIFYLRNLDKFIEELDVSIKNAGFVRPWYLANYAAPYPKMTLSDRFSLWSSFRARAPFHTFWLNGLVLLSALFGLSVILRKHGYSIFHIISIDLLILGMSIYNFVVPILSNGEADIAKHLFAFVEIIDICFCFNIACVLLLLSKKESRMAGIGAALAVLIIAALPIIKTMGKTQRSNMSYDSLEVGAIVQLGTYDNTPIKWRITDATDGTYMLVAIKPLLSISFDNDNSNLWSESDLRDWLNYDFYIMVFSTMEKTIIEETQHRVILAQANENLSEDGSSDFYAFHTPRIAFRGAEDAISAYANDKVFLPDITIACMILNEGYALPSCWLDTPYFLNAHMLRIVGEDGYIYMREAEEEYGLVPCIRVSIDEYSGSGSISDPFLLKIKQ